MTERLECESDSIWRGLAHRGATGSVLGHNGPQFREFAVGASRAHLVDTKLHRSSIALSLVSVMIAHVQIRLRRGQLIPELLPLPTLTDDACQQDGDCPGKSVCLCRASDASNAPNNCLPSGNCRVDGDCATDSGTGSYCSFSEVPGIPIDGGSNGDPFGIGYFCHTKDDCCVDSTDCKDASPSDVACVYAKQLNHWLCGSGP